MNINELEAGPEMNAEIVEKIFKYRVSWWSLHPADKEEIKGEYRESTYGMEVLLPDDKGDMPIREMLFMDTGWTYIPPYSTDIAAAYQVEDRIEELGLTHVYIQQLAKIACGYKGMPETIIRLGRGLYDDQLWGMIHATPEDRCRAALMAAEAE